MSMSKLREIITDYLAQDDITSRIDTFIRLAELRFDRELRVRQMQKTLAPQVIPASGKLALPVDFIELSSHRIIASPSVVPVLVPEDKFVAALGSNAPGLPRTYTIVGSQIWFAPEPDSSTYEYEMTYYQKIPPLALFGQNWVSNLHFDLYVYGALIEAEPFLVNDERIATWTSMYDRARRGLQDVDKRRLRPAGLQRPYRSGKMEHRNRGY